VNGAGRPAWRTGLGVAGLVAFGLVLALAAAELVLRLALRSADRYYVYPPGLTQSFEASPDLLPGVSGIARFIVDAEGLRGDELEAGHTFRVLAVGGSTTQCLYLDQDEAWPQRLQQLLAPRLTAVWVGNAGKAGRRTREHVLQVHYLLRQIPDVDVLLLLVGANDVMRRLADGPRYAVPDLDDPAVVERLIPRAFDRYPRRFGFFPPSRTALWALPSRARAAASTVRHWDHLEDRSGSHYAKRRRERAEARILDDLPDLASAVGEYTRNLEVIAADGRAHGARVIFMTQPTAYRDDLPEAHRRLLWMGAAREEREGGAPAYYSVEALARAFRLFNAALLDACPRLGVECIDLESLVPKDTGALYDDMHFNEAGAERVARILFEHLAGGPRVGQVGSVLTSLDPAALRIQTP